MPNRREFDHLFNGKFQIEIEGVTTGAFVACEGLEAEIDVVTFADGKLGETLYRKRPGRTNYRNIVLKRGVTQTSELWQWFKNAARGQVERKSGSIIVLDDTAAEIFRFNFFEAWPCRWKGLELQSDKPGSLIEEIEIAIELFERG